jgi:hypothetical protein
MHELSVAASAACELLTLYPHPKLLCKITKVLLCSSCCLSGFGRFANMVPHLQVCLKRLLVRLERLRRVTMKKDILLDASSHVRKAVSVDINTNLYCVDQTTKCHRLNNLGHEQFSWLWCNAMANLSPLAAAPSCQPRLTCGHCCVWVFVEAWCCMFTFKPTLAWLCIAVFETQSPGISTLGCGQIAECWRRWLPVSVGGDCLRAAPLHGMSVDMWGSTWGPISKPQETSLTEVVLQSTTPAL